MDPDAPVNQTSGCVSQPVQAMSQSYQSPQGSQQSSRQYAEGGMRLRSVEESEDFAIYVVSRDISLERVLRLEGVLLPREPSRFGGPSRPPFQIPQQAQANALTMDQAEDYLLK
ncbi:hypothetical protein F511_07284 [Dorcoceras hygrometricum]|uniref:Uncharacterized protein n=1 Tax=Dorcoceras hygrometricum TaxID=472368 RepID=A0A2Z7AWV0_9LAMI|nr:hypothetical protein F511_07284 [Dorcoceras hygrometricum]